MTRFDTSPALEQPDFRLLEATAPHIEDAASAFITLTVVSQVDEDIDGALHGVPVRSA